MDLKEKKEKDREAVYDIICDKLGVEKDAVKDDSVLKTDLGCDSLDVIELLMSVENTFGIIVEDYAYDNVKTVGDIINLVSHD